jgi:hypothetical protein
LKGEYSADSHVQDMNNLGYISLSLYFGGSCSCWNETLNSQGLGGCACNGYLQNTKSVHLSTGIVSVSSDSFQSLMLLNLFGENVFCSGTYWLYLDSPVFYGKLVNFTLTFDEPKAVVNLTMVEKA